MTLKYILLALQFLSLTGQAALLYWGKRHNRHADALPWQMGLLVCTVCFGVAVRLV